MKRPPAIGDHFYSIIPAGGVGSRLWPLSRADEPKFLLDLMGSGRSLLRSTWDRLQPLTDAEHTYIVTGYNHRHAVRTQVPEVLKRNMLLEPEPRESTAAICMAAAIIAKRDPEAIVGSFAADHFIVDEHEFRRVVAEAVLVAQAGYVATIGISPTSAATNFGYIETDGLIDPELTDEAFHVVQFVEKPDVEVATEYVADKKHLWNAGIFIAKASVLLEELEKSEPVLAQKLQKIAQDWDTPEGYETKDRLWGGLKKVAIDYSIAEPSAAEGRVAVVPGDFGWDDVGDFSAIAKHLIENTPGKLAILGDSARVMADASSGLIVGETDRLVAVIGMDDVIIVDTKDALLVTTKAQAQRVKGMVDLIKLSGRNNVL